MFLVVGAHEVGAGQVFVSSEHADEVFTFNVHEEREASTGTDEHGIEAILVNQILELASTADDKICLELHAHGSERFDFVVNDLLGQTEFRNAVADHATELVESFEDGHVVAFAAHVGSDNQTGREAPPLLRS